MQSCKECGASWDVNRIIDICPFCGMDLREKKTAANIDDAFAMIVEQHGKAVFLHGNRFLGLLGDYAPNLERERKLVKLVLESGAYRAIYEASISQKMHMVEKYTTVLSDSYFIDETWAKKALFWCFKALVPQYPFEHEEQDCISINGRFGDKKEISYKDMSVYNGSLNKYTGYESIVVVPEDIHTIGIEAFYANDSINQVILPSSVRKIGKKAFAHCTNLKSVKFSDGIQIVGDWAFVNCTSLDVIKLPNSVASIGEFAFQGCSKLETVILPANLSELQARTFADCACLHMVQIPKKLTRVGMYAFARCKSIENLIFANDLMEIGMYAFVGCQNLKKIVVPKKTFVFSNAFEGCGRKASDIIYRIIYDDKTYIRTGIAIKDGIMAVTSMDFVPDNLQERDSQWESVNRIIFSDGIEEIKMEAFKNMRNLQEVVFPASLRKIGFAAFQNCVRLKAIKIPVGVTVIASYAFEKCHNLASVSIPMSVNYIGENAFHGCCFKQTIVSVNCIVCDGNFQIMKK